MALHVNKDEMSYIKLYIYTRVCVYVCIYIYIYICVYRLQFQQLPEWIGETAKRKGWRFPLLHSTCCANKTPRYSTILICANLYLKPLNYFRTRAPRTFYWRLTLRLQIIRV